MFFAAACFGMPPGAGSELPSKTRQETSLMETQMH